MATLQQEKIGNILLDMVSEPDNPDNPKTKKEILIRADYSNKSAKQPSQVFSSKRLKEVLADKKIDKKSLVERLGEIAYEKDKRASISAISEIAKFMGYYAPVKQEIEEIISERKEIIKPE